MDGQLAFALLKPGLLGTEGYSYGRATLVGSQDIAIEIDVQRVNSGRWVDLDDATARRPRSEFVLRQVSAEEAASGIGTYVGCCVCIARTSSERGHSWDYGAVSGYSWDSTSQSGVLHIAFTSGVEPTSFRPDETQCLPYASYALRPCLGGAVFDLMPAEMRAVHDAALNHFRGTGCRATRRSKTILEKLHAPVVDEEHVVPLYDATSGSIRNVSIKYILDYSYYKEGGRRPPRGVELGESIFDGPTRELTVTAPDVAPPIRASPVATGAGALELTDILSDSDDDDDDTPPISAQVAGARSTTPSCIARQEPSHHRNRGMRNDPTNDLGSLVTLRETYARNPAMVRNIDRLISMSEAGSSERQVIMAGGTAAESPAQFRPTTMQRQIHRQLVNGTYALMGPQLVLESLQISIQSLELLPHPAVIRGFFSWDFATQGLCIMHFMSLTDIERRKRRAECDMSDFSRKNKLPRAPVAVDLPAIVDALGGLAAVVKVAYLPFVQTLVEAAQSFLRKLSRSSLRRQFGLPEARSELINWVNERFEQVRLLLAQERFEAALDVHHAFNEGDPSFTNLLQVVTECRLSHSERQLSGNVRTIHQANNRGNQHQPESRRKVKTANVTGLHAQVATATCNSNRHDVC